MLNPKYVPGMCSRGDLVILILLVTTPGATVSADLAAFPGARGQGASSVGGRGGDVYHVTTLDDYHPKTGTKIPGSLRHALRSATGPRTIVFDISGVIQLKAPLEIQKSQLTVAGQTSPGGITLCGYPVEIGDCQDVIVRYLRVRTGDFHARTPVRPADGFASFDAASANAIQVGMDGERIILDHLSTSWSIDECLSVTGCRDVTVQHCIIAESFNDSYHPKGRHGFGSLIRGRLTTDDQQQGIGGYTFYGNLWGHHRARNPSIGGEQHLPRGAPEGQRRRCDVNIVNNVIYNWGENPTHRSQDGHVRINLVSNYYVCGPSKMTKFIFREGEAGTTELYRRGNFLDHQQDTQHNGVSVDDGPSTAAYHQFDEQDRLLNPNDPSFNFLESVGLEIRTAEEAYRQVLKSCGASLWRDVHDRRILDSVVQRSGAIVDSQELWRDKDGVLAGIDQVPVRRRPDNFDTDQDGMPDAFERLHGLNPEDAADRNGHELDANGYTNLEIYLHGLTLNSDNPEIH